MAGQRAVGTETLEALQIAHAANLPDSPSRLVVRGAADIASAEEKKPRDPEQTRFGLAWMVVLSYVGLVAAVLVISAVYLFLTYNVDNMQKIATALLGALSGLAGILGFVIGYYFKEAGPIRKSKSTRRNAAPSG
jgi:hypothetical protein